MRILLFLLLVCASISLVEAMHHMERIRPISEFSRKYGRLPRPEECVRGSRGNINYVASCSPKALSDQEILSSPVKQSIESGMCPLNYSPVCGRVNGVEKMYTNRCFAQMNGAEILETRGCIQEVLSDDKATFTIKSDRHINWLTSRSDSMAEPSPNKPSRICCRGPGCAEKCKQRSDTSHQEISDKRTDKVRIIAKTLSDIPRLNRRYFRHEVEVLSDNDKPFEVPQGSVTIEEESDRMIE